MLFRFWVFPDCTFLDISRSWANELFLVGTWHNGDAAVNFEYDIKSRGLTLYRHKPEEGAV